MCLAKPMQTLVKTWTFRITMYTSSSLWSRCALCVTRMLSYSGRHQCWDPESEQVRFTLVLGASSGLL